MYNELSRAHDGVIIEDDVTPQQDMKIKHLEKDDNAKV
jgi:hypothetical protein